MATTIDPAATGSSMPALIVQHSSQTGTTTSGTNQTSNGAQNPIFTQAQSNMQGQSADLYNKILSGQVQNYGIDPATRQAAWYDFQQNQLPLLAAQNGIGSPALNAAGEQLNLRLAGLGGQTAMSNALQAFGTGANTAFQPVGYTTNNQLNNNQNINTTNDQNTQTANVGGVLNGLSDWVSRFFGP